MTLRVNYRIIFFCLICLIAFLSCGESVSAQQEFYPFLAEVSAATVNVRAGQSANFEKLCQLKSGDEVIVVGKEYSWYKIKLPISADSYISSDFVDMVSGIKGLVKGDKVNVRARKTVSSTILGRAGKGEEVFIVGSSDGWHKIEPIEGSFGWISEDLLAFKSKKVSNVIVSTGASLREQEALRIAKEKEEAEKKRLKELAEKERLRKIKDVSFSGTLELDTEKGKYKVTSINKPTYYLDGFDHLLDRFLHYKVSVKGTKSNVSKNANALPIVKISEIKLVY